MRNKRRFEAFYVSRKAESSLREGHPWVYGEEVLRRDGGSGNGDIVDVFSEKGVYLGSGMLSEHSKIRVRILSSNANESFDEAFFRRRIKYAVDYRLRVMPNDTDACRLIFGDADGLPGLIVDKFASLLSVQVLCYGTEIRKSMIFSLLLEILSDAGIRIDGIFERNDVAVRNLEGLESYKAWFENERISAGKSAVTLIEENGVRYEVDVENGQKTGFFLDQKYNRREIASVCKGMRVLDCFTHTGSFALNAVAGGAAHVTAVDVSRLAVDRAKENARLNGFEDRMDFLCADVFDLLPEFKQEKKYDLIILDPPAFTKSRSTVRSAEKGYGEINASAMKALRRGAFLATCSCSHFMKDEMFRAMLRKASHEAGKTLRLVFAGRQSPDHPSLPDVPETEYLKFYLFQIL